MLPILILFLQNPFSISFCFGKLDHVMLPLTTLPRLPSALRWTCKPFSKAHKDIHDLALPCRSDFNSALMHLATLVSLLLLTWSMFTSASGPLSLVFPLSGTFFSPKSLHFQLLFFSDLSSNFTSYETRSMTTQSKSRPPLSTLTLSHRTLLYFLQVTSWSYLTYLLVYPLSLLISICWRNKYMNKHAVVIAIWLPAKSYINSP